MNTRTGNALIAMRAGSLEAAVAEPLGNAQRQQQPAKRQAHQRDDEGKPPGVGAGARGPEPAQECLKQDGGQDACTHHGRTPLDKLTRAIVG